MVPHEITGLLRAWSDGDRTALERLVPLVEGEMRRLARGYMRRERKGHTLQAAALVNEGFVRLADAPPLGCAGGAQKVSLDEATLVAAERSVDLVALDRALEGLATLDPRRSQVVELRYFGGLTVDATA